MKPIVTVTLSPSLDGDSETEVIRPTHKIRTSRTASTRPAAASTSPA